jgi:hypothetical protein
VELAAMYVALAYVVVEYVKHVRLDLLLVAVNVLIQVQTTATVDYVVMSVVAIPVLVEHVHFNALHLHKIVVVLV